MSEGTNNNLKNRDESNSHEVSAVVTSINTSEMRDGINIDTINHTQDLLERPVSQNLQVSAFVNGINTRYRVKAKTTKPKPYPRMFRELNFEISFCEWYKHYDKV